MKRITILLCLLPMMVFAEGLTLTWTAPTQNTDGSPITNAVSTRIYELVAEVDDPTIETYRFESVSPGTHSYVATVVNDEDVESSFSNPASKDAGPTSVIEEEVFTVVKTMETFVLISVGTIAIGTTCDDANTVNGHNSIPVDEVTWTGTVRPVVAVAKCG